MDSLTKAIGVVVVAVGIAFILSVILALPVMWLWNSTLPELFKLNEISLWMAWKISLLCSFLFKSHSFKSE